MRFLFSVVFLLSTLHLHAQDASRERKWGIKAGYSFNKGWDMISGNIGDIRLETNYQFLKYLELGGYFGYTVTQTFKKQDGYRLGSNSSVFIYGVDANFLILPAIFDKNYRYNPYITVKAGGYHVFADNSFTPHGSGVSLFSGIGFSFLFLDWLSLFGEYGIGLGEGTYRNNIYKSEDDTPGKNITSFRFGLEFKF